MQINRLTDEKELKPIPNGMSGYETVVRKTYFPMKFSPVDGGGSFRAEVMSQEIGSIAVTRIWATGRYHGQIWVDRNAPEQQHNFVLNLSEEGGLIFDGARHAVTKPGDLILMNPKQAFEVLQQETAQSLAMLIPVPLLANQWGNIDDLCLIAVPSSEGPAALLREMLHCFWTQKSNIHPSTVQELVCALVHLIGATFRHAPNATSLKSVSVQSHFLRIRDFIHANLSNDDLSADLICDALGISKSYLFSIMSRSNTTLRRFILAQRLECARQLLEFPTKRSRSISEIAFLVGFREHSHFTRCFSERYGCSPKAYRVEFCRNHNCHS